MGLFIAQSMSGVDFNVGQAQLDIISMSKVDIDIGFDEPNPVSLEGVSCIPVIYTSLNETGPTPQRIFDLVNSNGFTSPPHIIVLADDGSLLLPDGTTAAGNGFAMEPGSISGIGSAANPFADHVCTIYDVTLCGFAGIKVDREGGGKTQMCTDVMLYHELSHCFHFVTGTVAVDGGGNFDSVQEEVNAEIDENDMRDVRGVPHREVTSHWGACGGGACGATSCCIIASLSTGSTYSEEVNKLRYMRDMVLRNGEAGDKFFDTFFHEYYAFSPEVTRLLGHFPALKGYTKDYFVNPLILSLELLIHYTDTKGKGLVPFIQEQRRKKPEMNVGELALLRAFVSALENEEYNKHPMYAALCSVEGFDALTQYINKSILENEVIRWSLYDTLKIWLDAVAMIDSNTPDAEQVIYKTISQWIGYFPISEIWNEFNRLQCIRELEHIEEYIFDKEAQQIFSQRLLQQTTKHHAEISAWSKN